MVVTCPECGARNRTPDIAELGRIYCCSGCKARLAVAAAAVSTEGVADLDVPAGGSGRTEALPATAPGVSRPAFRGARLAAIGRFLASERNAVVLLVLVALLVHLFVLPYWAEPYMDEAHYVPEARSILDESVVTHPEHPPLGKLLIASGITIFGDNEWGWRVIPVVFAVASVVVFYFICRTLGGRAAAILAAFLIVFETLTFVHTGLATLDVFALFFMLLAFMFYLRDRYVLSGVSLALAGLCKMTGLLGIGVIVIHWLVVKRGKRPPMDLVYVLMLPLALLMLLMPVLDWAATGEWVSPIDRLADMLSHHEGLTIETLTPEQRADVTFPWEWILSPTGHLSFSTGGAITLINPMIWMMIIPAMGYMTYEWVKRRSQAALFVMLWFAVTCLLWIPLVLITDRVSYLYYFLPAAGAVCLAVGMALVRIWNVESSKRVDRRSVRLLIGGYLALNVIAFVFLAPVLKTLDTHVNFLP